MLMGYEDSPCPLIGLMWNPLKEAFLGRLACRKDPHLALLTRFVSVWRVRRWQEYAQATLTKIVKFSE